MTEKSKCELYWVVKAVCESGHVQTFKLDCNTFSREYAEQWAALLDGTSQMYVYPPGRESVIGKCGICQEPYKCEVNEDAEIS